MIRSRKADGKQFLLPMFDEEVVPVPAEGQKELEGALAELLLESAKGEVAEGTKGGCQ